MEKAFPIGSVVVIDDDYAIGYIKSIAVKVYQRKAVVVSHTIRDESPVLEFPPFGRKKFFRLGAVNPKYLKVVA